MFITSLFDEKIDRHKIKINEKVLKVSEVKHKISGIVNIKPSQLGLVLNGVHLEDDNSSVELDEDDCMVIINKEKDQNPMEVDKQNANLKRLLIDFCSVINVPFNADLVEKKMRNREFFHKILEQVPSFGLDTVAIDLLQNKNLFLSAFSKKNNSKKLLEEHPSLGEVLPRLMGEVKPLIKNNYNHYQLGPRPRNKYSIEQMSEEETEEEELESDGGSRRENLRNVLGSMLPSYFQQQQQQQRQFRTNQQQQQQQQPQPQQPGVSGQQQQQFPGISTDFFRQVIQQITQNQQQQDEGAGGGGGGGGVGIIQQQQQQQQSGITGIGGSGSGTQQFQISQEDIQQMLEFGVPDEETARKTLERTQGNLELALELFFDGNEMV